MQKISIAKINFQDIIDHINQTEVIESKMEPIRLEYVKLKRSLEAAEDRYLSLTRHEQQGIDETQIMIDNQVLSDKVEERVSTKQKHSISMAD